MPASSEDQRPTEREQRTGADRARCRLAPGDVIVGRYRVEELLGEGGMGVVVAARDVVLGRRVAVKLLKPEGRDALRARRFVREARAVAALESEHVVRLGDFGELPDGGAYMVMELLAGRDLASEVAARGPLPIEEAVDAVIEASCGLAAAHALGIVHRDVKPSNLFRARRADGTTVVKVLDFGVSKVSRDVDPDVGLTATATTVGSPLYMAPEQIRDARLVDHRADVWSLGVALHFLLTATMPFRGALFASVCAAIAADAPARVRAARPEVPAGLEQIVLRCLEKAPEARPSSAAELAHALVPYASARGADCARALVARGGAPAVAKHAEHDGASSPWTNDVAGATGTDPDAEARPPRPVRHGRAPAVTVAAFAAAAALVALASAARPRAASVTPSIAAAASTPVLSSSAQPASPVRALVEAPSATMSSAPSELGAAARAPAASATAGAASARAARSSPAPARTAPASPRPSTVPREADVTTGGDFAGSALDDHE